MIVGTAGHVDHGKTALVRALTGVDTDRLPEEKARGITIDLGFAYLPSQTGVIGFVDVPGHERFVGTMAAGASGIDFLMLVVAADDGVMPQTREHLAIADLLGARRGLAVISKADLAGPERRHAVEAQIRALLAGTALDEAPIWRPRLPPAKASRTCERLSRKPPKAALRRVQMAGSGFPSTVASRFPEPARSSPALCCRAQWRSATTCA